MEKRSSRTHRGETRNATCCVGRNNVFLRPTQHVAILTLSLLFLVLSPEAVQAQESTSVFNFLSLPYSAHSTALGGKNISLVEDDISLVSQNPALLSSVSNHTMGLGFLSYMRGTKAGSAHYAQLAGERGTWGASAHFVGYGQMKETLATGEIIGDMRALDMCLSGQYSYELSDRWVGGAAGKFIYSHYGEFTSCALAVDLGLNYFRQESDFSFSAVARNLGGQVKAFADHHERLPFDLEVGVTKGLAHAPVYVSLTMVDLTRWSKDYFYNGGKKVSGGRVLTNHFNLGVDIRPTRNIYVAAGYNFRRASEMKAAGSSHAAGLSFGAGLHLSRFQFGLAYAKYHMGAPTLSVSLAYTIK